MKGFLKQKLAFLIPKDPKKAKSPSPFPKKPKSPDQIPKEPKKTKSPELLDRKKTDIIQYIYAQHAVLYDQDDLKHLENL